ncbi:ATPase, F1 complex, gamma subunit domain-containing protein [Entophlyctis helioformis]|nr:ATPase, F1 complex, gamma subunit domain-containing protein [Entophlyctis helioformis]
MFFAAARSIPATAALPVAAALQPARNMATLKEISMRLKSIQNIAKITKSMKMIASTKVARAQKTMEQARIYGQTGTSLHKHAGVSTVHNDNSLVVTVSSDRGLCGGIHSSVSKATKRFLAANPNASSAILGQKARAQIQRDYRENIAISFDGVAKNVPTWLEAALIGDGILTSRPEYSSAAIIYNTFKSVIAYEAGNVTVPATRRLLLLLAAYEMEDDVLKNFEEFTLANTLYWAIAEGYASEMCAKRAAMENATKNAGEMIQKLTLTYNRSRQASITNDLIDIIVGAMAMD